MHNFKMILMAMVACSILTIHASAQNTNLLPVLPTTTLEALESSTGKVIIRATAPMGSVAASTAAISVVCKEDTAVNPSHKEYGIMVGIKMSGQPEDRTLIDYDELESMLSSLDYLSKIEWSVTSLPSFDAGYTTKAGLRVAAFGSQRAGRVEFAVRSIRMAKGILLTSDQVGRFFLLVDQAKTKLDALRGG